MSRDVPRCHEVFPRLPERLSTSSCPRSPDLAGSRRISPDLLQDLAGSRHICCKISPDLLRDLAGSRQISPYPPHLAAPARHHFEASRVQQGDGDLAEAESRVISSNLGR